MTTRPTNNENRVCAGPFQFRAVGDLLECLRKRTPPDGTKADRGEVARRDLDRYYHALTNELLAVTLTEGEAGLIVSVLEGIDITPGNVGLLGSFVARRLEGLGVVDRGSVILAKLQRLTYAQAIAIVDAVERYRLEVQAGTLIAEALRKAGLVR